MPRYRTTFSSTVKPDTLTYIDSKVNKAVGISRGDVLDAIVDEAREREKAERVSKKQKARG